MFYNLNGSHVGLGGVVSHHAKYDINNSETL